MHNNLKTCLFLAASTLWLCAGAIFVPSSPRGYYDGRIYKISNSDGSTTAVSQPNLLDDWGIPNTST